MPERAMKLVNQNCHFDRVGLSEKEPALHERAIKLVNCHFDRVGCANSRPSPVRASLSPRLRQGCCRCNDRQADHTIYTSRRGAESLTDRMVLVERFGKNQRIPSD